MIQRIFQRMLDERRQQREAELYRDLIRQEAKLGSDIFGPVPDGHRREFFCLDQHTWIWHEEWNDQGRIKVLTTRYDVRPHGIIKSQNGQYGEVSLRERRQLIKAIKTYIAKVDASMYGGMIAQH